jgi:hypothetical protein
LRGTGNERGCCAGCKLPLSSDTEGYHCCFKKRGFTGEDGRRYQPCETAYHPTCIRLGAPFSTRLRNNKGLAFPPSLILPNFVCEACTVRAHLKRELLWTQTDYEVLALERARLIDSAHAWSTGTYKKYQTYLRHLQAFERSHGVRALVPTTLERPSDDPSLAIMWGQEAYALRPGGSRSAPGDQVTFTTARGVRSAASQYYGWDLQLSHPGSATKDAAANPVLGCGIPTNSLGYTWLSQGMGARRGEASTPSVALLHRHVAWMDAHLADAYNTAPNAAIRRELARAGLALADAYNTAPNAAIRRELARAGLANVGAWCGWLRGGELFSLEWSGVHLVEPEHGASAGLPEGLGAVLWELQEQTKSSRNTVADVVMSYTTSSGLSLGRWLHRLREALGQDEFPTCASPVFVHEDGSPWTSAYYRSNYLLPLLNIQRLQGDKHLKAFDNSPGNSLADKFYSMHSYRSGARSHVSRKREGCSRKATQEEIDEHGRWRTIVRTCPCHVCIFKEVCLTVSPSRDFVNNFVAALAWRRYREFLAPPRWSSRVNRLLLFLEELFNASRATPFGVRRFLRERAPVSFLFSSAFLPPRIGGGILFIFIVRSVFDTDQDLQQRNTGFVVNFV